jgi:hypothetical protein
VSGQRVTWSSSDVSRATVSSGGIVRGVQPGDVEVRASSGGATDQRALSVRVGVPVPDGSAPLTSTLLDGAVLITVNAGAVPAGTVLHLRALADPPADARLLPSSAVELGPSIEFGGPVTLALAYPASVPPAERSYLRLHSFASGVWSPVPGSSVDLSAERVQGVIARAGVFAVFRPPAAASLRIDAGDGQLGLPASIVPVAPRVLVRDVNDDPVAGVPVRFTVSAGGGSIIGDDTGISGTDGRATLPGSWRLGPTTGTNALTAAIVGNDIPAVTFSATAEAVLLVIARQIAGAVSGRVATTQPRLEFRTASGTLLSVGDGVTAQRLSGSGTLVGTLTINAVNGVATFSDLRIDGVGAHRLRFSAGGLQATGAEFTVTQELASLEVVVQPDGAQEDKVFTVQPVIRLLDDAGLPYLPPKTVAATLSSGDGDLRGTRSVTSSAGLATYTNLRIDDEWGPHRLRFATTAPTRSVLSDMIFVTRR